MTMTTTMTVLRALIQEECGADLAEYALIAVLLGLGSVASFQHVTNAVASSFTAIATTMTSAI